MHGFPHPSKTAVFLLDPQQGSASPLRCPGRGSPPSDPRAGLCLRPQTPEQSSASPLRPPSRALPPPSDACAGGLPAQTPGQCC